VPLFLQFQYAVLNETGEEHKRAATDPGTPLGAVPFGNVTTVTTKPEVGHYVIHMHPLEQEGYLEDWESNSSLALQLLFL
jgi:hypothetical protein